MRLHPLHLVGGLALWGLWFVAIYVGLSYACAWADAPEPSFGWINVMLGIPTLLTVAALLLLARHCRRHPAHDRLGRLIRWVSVAAYCAGAVATAAVGLPLMVLPPCV